MKKLIIPSTDGYPLSALYAIPVDGSIGTIIISAATGIKKEYYVNFAQHLVRNGYNVLLYDYRGIGGSAPVNLASLKDNMHEWGIKDMEAALSFLVCEKKLTNIIWIGHSAGAQLVGFVKSHQHIKKIISINSVFGYYGYFHFPRKILIWLLWKFVAPLMIRTYGYGLMRKIGWGENLPPNMLMQWRSWCLSITYFRDTILEVLGTDKFYHMALPFHSISVSDDALATEQTVSRMLDFFPNAKIWNHTLEVKKFTREKVGHVGFFRRKFENSLWPFLMEIIERDESAELPGNTDLFRIPNNHPAVHPKHPFIESQYLQNN